MLEKTIKVSNKTHRQLFELKKIYGCNTIDDLLTHLIEIDKKYSKAKIVRLIE